MLLKGEQGVKDVYSSLLCYLPVLFYYVTQAVCCLKANKEPLTNVFFFLFNPRHLICMVVVNC